MPNDINEITAVLIDDELNAIKNLSKLLSDYCPIITVIGTSQDIQEATFLINNLKPNVIFLDVSMPSESGFDLLNKLTYQPYVIFVTAHDKFALRAIKLCAVDFILKPIHPDDIIKAVNKIKAILSLQNQIEIQENYKDVYNSLNHYLQNSTYTKKICIPSSNGYDVIQTDEIIHIKGEGNYSTFFLQANRKIIVSKTLREYEDLLEEVGFFRIHKSSIINLKHLVKTIKQDEIKVIMSDGLEINVSRRRSPLFLDKIKMIM
ncbi:MAG: response regulator transcription factor [Bacteroidota bacterium]|nr:response regulator transcription factor [Bacteroidota bacterium]